MGHALLDPNDANPEARQWPMMWFIQKDELDLSNFLLGNFNWKAGQMRKLSIISEANRSWYEGGQSPLMLLGSIN